MDQAIARKNSWMPPFQYIDHFSDVVLIILGKINGLIKLYHSLLSFSSPTKLPNY